MHHTYKCDIGSVGYVEPVKFVQSFYNFPIQIHVYVTTVAEMQQDNKNKHALHHTAALSLSSTTATFRLS